MNEANQSLVLRWARWQTRALARVWPDGSRRWGEAIASEAEEIEQPLQAVGWALGGATVYLRALGTHLLEWLKMPAGQRGGGAAPLGGGPKRSRLFAVVVLACAAALLCLPEGREALRTVRVVWEDFAQRDTDKPELEKIAKLGEKEKDARMMAFAALSLQDGNNQELTERAVGLDPRLTWIYAAAAHQHSPDEPVKVEWLAKAEAADPDNAVPYLLAADAMAKPRLTDAGDQRSLTEPEIRDRLTGNAEWTALMEKAFRAPRYDSYYRRHRELNREIWRREPELPFTAAFEGLRMHSIPNLYYLLLFSKFLVQQSEKERNAGHLEKAQELLQTVDGLGTHMQHGNSAEIEEEVGLSLQHSAAEGWKSFYQASGKTAEAEAAAQRMAEIEQHRREDGYAAQRIWQERNRERIDAWAVQLSAIVTVFAAVLAILSIGLFEMRPAIWKRETILRRVLGWVADFAPGTALAACTVLLVSFLPYARSFAAFRAGDSGAQDERQIMAKFWNLSGVTWILGGSDAAVLGWTALTVVLSLVAALLLARMVYRAMRRTAPQV